MYKFLYVISLLSFLYCIGKYNDVIYNDILNILSYLVLKVLKYSHEFVYITDQMGRQN